MFLPKLKSEILFCNYCEISLNFHKTQEMVLHSYKDKSKSYLQYRIVLHRIRLSCLNCVQEVSCVFNFSCQNAAVCMKMQVEYSLCCGGFNFLIEFNHKIIKCSCPKNQFRKNLLNILVQRN